MSQPTEVQPQRFDARSCAIREFTGDRVAVGRCWHFVGDHDVCERHGDVSVVMKLYRETGSLTDDHAHQRRFDTAASKPRTSERS